MKECFDNLTLATMDIFKPASLKSKAYRNAIVQKGGIIGMQSGGLANLNGAFTKRAIPLSGTTIKATSRAAKPIAIVGGKEIFGVASRKRGATKLTKHTTPTSQNKTVVPRPHKKIRRAKWRSL